jgi:hypothetical protein
MAKKAAVALMLGVSCLGVIFAVIFLLNKNEAIVYNDNYIWHIEPDPENGSEVLVRGGKIKDIRNDVKKLITALNNSWEDSEAGRSDKDGLPGELPKIRLQKVDRKTAIIEIANDQYLNKMGSSGAQGYLASVTFTLTENAGINSVKFMFDAGEHAMPGVYDRSSFPGFKTMNEDDAKKL